MPWTVKDVDKFVKGLSDDQKKTWVKVANTALKDCIADGGDDESCSPKAIKFASAAIKKQKPVEEEPEPEQEERAYKELDTSIMSLMSVVNKSFYDEFGNDYWVRDVFIDHPKLGDAAIVENMSGMFKVPMTISGESVEFSPEDDWKKVRMIYEEIGSSEPEEEPEPEPEEELEPEPEVEENFKERATGIALRVVEGLPDRNVVPLPIDVQIIRPGFGNSRDNHYYSAEMLEKCAPVFEGAKMYETDHRQDEKSTRTWVSTIKHVEGFTSEGAPIGRVIIHDEAFAKKVLALNEAGLLDKMECSILAAGTAKRGKIDGKSAKVVESIDMVESVDWVTRAGAGGKAIKLAENKKPSETKSDTDLEESERVTIQEQSKRLDVKVVEAIVGKLNFPKATIAKLRQSEYADVDALESAIKAEREYIKEISGGAKVFAMGGVAAQDTKVDYDKRISEAMARHGSIAIQNLSEVK